MLIEHVTGRIKCGDNVIFGDVAIWLNVTPATPTRLERWHGGLMPPTAVDLMSLDKCRIELVDGRAGDIWFEMATPGGAATFRGTGPLT